MSAMSPENAKALREPFPPEMVGKLPRVTCKDCSDRSKTCSKHTKQKCQVCDAYVSTAHIHLDYVGHAGVTDRLLSVDPEWSWEPFAVSESGLPAFSVSGSEAALWVRLTVCGVTRPAVGTAPAGSFELPKQLISDAIRNGAMRFGVALDLWSKEDLTHEEPPALPARADRSVIDALIVELSAIEEPAVRAKQKRAFTAQFGPPMQLPADRADEAIAWVANVTVDPERPFVAPLEQEATQ